MHPSLAHWHLSLSWALAVASFLGLGLSWDPWAALLACAAPPRNFLC